MLTKLQFLRNPGKYRSCSALAPIANPINCLWGQKAFKGYLGEENMDEWEKYDATVLISRWKGPLDFLIDVVSNLSLRNTDKLVEDWLTVLSCICRVLLTNFTNKASFSRTTC